MKKAFLLLLATLTINFLPAQAILSPKSQDTSSAKEEIINPSVNGSPDITIANSRSFFEDPEMLNTILVTVLFLVITLFILYRKKTESLTGEEYVRLIGILLVIFGALFVMAAGWSKEHAAPVFGLLGTIAGFLLGRQSTSPGNPGTSV